STVEKGPSLAALLSYAGVTYSTACKNDELRWWIEATSRNGQAAVVTAGEIDPLFGNRPAILSINENGQFLTASGPRLIVPNDGGGQRNWKNVPVITVGRAPAQIADPPCASSGLVSPIPPPGSVLVNGDVASPTTYTFAQLQALSQVNQTVSFLSGSTPN